MGNDKQNVSCASSSAASKRSCLAWLGSDGTFIGSTTFVSSWQRHQSRMVKAAFGCLNIGHKAAYRRRYAHASASVPNEVDEITLTSSLAQMQWQSWEQTPWRAWLANGLTRSKVVNTIKHALPSPSSARQIVQQFHSSASISAVVQYFNAQVEHMFFDKDVGK